jgi:hypothetical protein
MKISGMGQERGTALIEFTLVAPLFLLLMLNTVNFGFYTYAWVTVGNAARAAVEYQVYNGCAVASCPPTPLYPAISSPLFTTDTSSLPGTAPTLLICKNFNGATSVVGGTGTCTIPADPEQAAFTLYSATVTYAFSPLFSAASLTYLLPTNIQQQVVMRSMQ